MEHFLKKERNFWKRTGEKFKIRKGESKGTVEKAILWRDFYVGTGLVPVLTLTSVRGKIFSTRLFVEQVQKSWLDIQKYEVSGWNHSAGVSGA